MISCPTGNTSDQRLISKETRHTIQVWCNTFRLARCKYANRHKRVGVESPKSLQLYLALAQTRRSVLRNKYHLFGMG